MREEIRELCTELKELESYWARMPEELQSVEYLDNGWDLVTEALDKLEVALDELEFEMRLTVGESDG